MVEKEIVIGLQQGLQARLAAKFVQKASSFNSEISIIKNGRLVVGKSIMGVMALSAKKGEEITLVASGSDEQEAITALGGFLLGRD